MGVREQKRAAPLYSGSSSSARRTFGVSSTTRTGGVDVSNFTAAAATPVIRDFAVFFFFGCGFHTRTGGSGRKGTVIGIFMKKPAGPCGNLEPKSRRPDRLPVNFLTCMPLCMVDASVRGRAQGLRRLQLIHTSLYERKKTKDVMNDKFLHYQ